MKRFICVMLSCCFLFSMISMTTFAATFGDLNGETNITIMGVVDKEKMVTYDFYVVFPDGNRTRIRTTAYAIYSEIEKSSEMINVAYTFYGVYESGFSGDLEIEGNFATLDIYYMGNFLLTMTFEISYNGNMTHIVYPVDGDPIIRDY